jgi:hypothetical protein
VLDGRVGILFLHLLDRLGATAEDMTGKRSRFDNVRLVCGTCIIDRGGHAQKIGARFAELGLS